MNTQTQEALKMAIDLLEDDLMDLVYEQDTEFKSKYAGGYKPERLKYAAELIVRGKEAIQACKEALAQPAQEPVLNVEKIINEFPLLDDEGLDEDKHHCEWAIQQDRKRLHAIIKNTHPAPHPAQEPVARIEVFNLLTKNGAFAIKEEWLWNIRYINSKGIIRKFPNEYPSEKKYAIQSAKYWADFLNCKIVEVDNRGNK